MWILALQQKNVAMQIYQVASEEAIKSKLKYSDCDLLAELDDSLS